ncbi:hypothetical protein CK203_100852 [Vitis vinifera]|uniref:Uncharacterized protein n=1 Tax=Vitis vinifera TaxID=29760 RepID=A0A438DQN5_VITVI|nr:hypothetical protein CK203_100852 [Vitis vinifera]
MEAAPKLPSGMINVHRSALMMKKLMGLVNRNPTWPPKLNKAANLEEATPLPPPPRVARIITTPPAPLRHHRSTPTTTAGGASPPPAPQSSTHHPYPSKTTVTSSFCPRAQRHKSSNN